MKITFIFKDDIPVYVDGNEPVYFKQITGKLDFVGCRENGRVGVGISGKFFFATDLSTGGNVISCIKGPGALLDVANDTPESILSTLETALVSGCLA